MTGIWRTIFNLTVAGAALFGVVLAGAGWPATSGPVEAIVGLLHPGGPLAWTPSERFGIGLQGALTLMIVMLAWAAAEGADRAGAHSPSIWRKIMWATLAWYVVDSAISCANGFWPNAISNTLLTIGFVGPILLSGALRPKG